MSTEAIITNINPIEAIVINTKKDFSITPQVVIYNNKKDFSITPQVVIYSDKQDKLLILAYAAQNTRLVKVKNVYKVVK